MTPYHTMLSNGVVMPRIALGTAPLQTRDPEEQEQAVASSSSPSPSSLSSSSSPRPPLVPKFQGFLPEKATRSVVVALDHVLTSSSSSSSGGCSEASHSLLSHSHSQKHDDGPILHLDTALYYRSQKLIAYALNHYYMTGQLRDRSSIFITTKVFHPHNGFGTDDMCMPPNLNDMTPQQV